MLKRIFDTIEKLFPIPDYHSELEKYIASRFPKNNGDVEQLEREFNMIHFRRRYLCNLE
jgi:hypothetical protein